MVKKSLNFLSVLVVSLSAFQTYKIYYGWFERILIFIKIGVKYCCRVLEISNVNINSYVKLSVGRELIYVVKPTSLLS